MMNCVLQVNFKPSTNTTNDTETDVLSGYPVDYPNWDFQILDQRILTSKVSEFSENLHYTRPCHIQLPDQQNSGFRPNEQFPEGPNQKRGKMMTKFDMKAEGYMRLQLLARKPKSIIKINSCNLRKLNTVFQSAEYCDSTASLSVRSQDNYCAPLEINIMLHDYRVYSWDS